MKFEKKSEKDFIYKSSVRYYYSTEITSYSYEQKKSVSRNAIIEIIPVTMSFVLDKINKNGINQRNTCFPIYYDTNSKEFFELHDEMNPIHIIGNILETGSSINYVEVKNPKWISLEALSIKLLTKEFESKLNEEI